MEESLHSALADASNAPADALDPPTNQEPHGAAAASLLGEKRARERDSEPDPKRPHVDREQAGAASHANGEDPAPDARAPSVSAGAAPDEVVDKAQDGVDVDAQMAGTAEALDSLTQSFHEDGGENYGAAGTDATAAPDATAPPMRTDTQNDHEPEDEQKVEGNEGAEHDQNGGDDATGENGSDNFEEADDLDLDAIMAQLQRHTERANMQPVNKETEELSIEQQLKGALSSLQDLDAEEDDEDDNGDAQFALDQLSQMLNQEADASQNGAHHDVQHGPQPDTQPDTQHGTQNGAQRGAKHDAQDDAQTQSETLGASAEPGHAQSSVEIIRNRALENAKDGNALSPAAGAPVEGPSRDHTGTSEEVSAVRRPSTQTESRNTAASSGGGQSATEGKPFRPDGSARTREYLLAKMPPPPTHLGPLPPMPPPPAALTSPIAPYTALELARNSRIENGAGTSEARRMSSRLQNIYSPTFTEAPPLSRSYETELAKQVDDLEKEDNRKEERHYALLLNDNQTILQARQRCIPLLDSLAAQVLDVLSFSHYQETFATVMQPDSERGMAYRMLLDSFEDMKRIFVKWKTQSSRNEPMPKPEEVRPFLPYNIPGVEETRENLICIQRANLATFVAALFGTIEIGFWELDEWFLKIFVPESGRLLKQQATIYLDLKTQAYISAVESSNDEKLHKAALDHLFPHDLETKMQDILGERVTLAPSELDFVSKCHRRRENILAEDPKDLPTRYHWVPFLRELSDYISRNHYTLLPSKKYGSTTTDVASTPPPGAVPQRAYVARKQASVPPVSSGASSSAVSAHSNSAPKRRDSSLSEAKGTNEPSRSSTDRSEQLPEDSKSMSGSGAAPALSGKTDAGSQARTNSEASSPASQKRHPDIPAEGHPLFPPLPKQVLPPPTLSGSNSEDSEHRAASTERSRRPGPRPQSQAPLAANIPTDTLAVYEAAKKNAEGTDAIRTRTSMFTTRRTWTKEEEEALLKGMDRVQGPYWAQILELYGPGGKISEVLKDRNQVQLKDKARNLKMFFFRLGLPIPAVFQYVTGDYESRRTSGKKVRDKKTQRTGPSDLSQQPNIPTSQLPTASSSQASSLHLPPSAGYSGPTLNTSGTPSAAQSSFVSRPSSAAAGMQDVNRSSFSASSTNDDSSPDNISYTASSVSARNLSQSLLGKSDDAKNPDGSISESHTTKGSDGNKGDARSDPDGTRRVPTVSSESSAAPNERDLGSGKGVDPVGVPPGAESSTSPSSRGNDQITEGSARASEGNNTSSLGETFGAAEEKDEDLSSLMNRVGAYVENH